MVGDGAHGGQMLDRLVRRAVFAKPDRVMRHDEERADAHQRGQPHRRPRIVGEAEEGAAIGDQPAMQRDAVHHRRHGVLADAVVDIAVAVGVRRQFLGLAGLGVVGRRQVGRTAERLGQRAVDDFQRHFRGLARRDLRLVGGELLLVGVDRRVEVLAAACRWCGARIRRPCRRHPTAPFSQAARGAAASHAGLAPGRQDVVRDLEGRQDPSSGSCASRRSRPCRAASRARPWCPALFGAPKPMVVLAAISVGLSDFCACSMAEAIASGSWPSMRNAFQPDALKRATWSVESDSETGPSMEMLLSSQKTISLFSLRWPASASASWLMPSIRQPSPTMRVGVVVDERIAELRVHDALGERHADGVGDALAERAGRRLDALGKAVFRVAGGLGAELAEVLDLLDRHVRIAGQIEQRIEQHRAVAGRQHEAVAVRPFRVLRIVFQVFREQHGRDVGAAHRQAGMAGIRLLDGIHREKTDRIGHPVMLFTVCHGGFARQLGGDRALAAGRAADT